jgi:ribonuclease HI
MTHFLVHTDGAAKGNPGPAGIGVALYRDGEAEPVAVIGESIGEATNNVAEYRALVRGLSEALLRGADSVEIRTDSELMARQIQGRYKINSPLLLPLHAEALALLRRFDRAAVKYVPRGENALADRLANQGVAAAKPGAGDAKAGGNDGAAARTAPAPPAEDAPGFRHSHSTTVDGETLVWNVERLWEAARDLPVRPVLLDSVSECLDADCWFGGQAPTGRQVAEHARRIYEADFSHPIILSASGQLMDGGHRIARAWLEGRTEIDAVRFEHDPVPDVRRPAESAAARKPRKPRRKKPEA